MLSDSDWESEIGFRSRELCVSYLFAALTSFGFTLRTIPDSVGVMKKRLPSPEHADTLSLVALRRLLTGLVEKAERAETRLATLEGENAGLA